MRTCPRCKQELSDESFNWKIKNRKRASYCRECSRDYIRHRYLNNLEYYAKKARRNNNRHIQKLYNYIGNYFQVHPCIDCGETDILVLEFDHRKPADKFAEVGIIIKRGLSLKVLQDEMAKCDVRCANCHRRKTAKEHKSWRTKFASVA